MCYLIYSNAVTIKAIYLPRRKVQQKNYHELWSLAEPNYVLLCATVGMYSMYVVGIFMAKYFNTLVMLS